MSTRPDDLVPEHALTPAQRAALHAAAAHDPDFADALARWHDLHAALRADVGRAAPNRHLFALCALAEGGHADLLTPDEYVLADAARADFLRAVRRHPGLADAADNICAAVDDLDTLWDAHEAGELVAPPTLRRVGRWVRWGVLVAALAVFVAWAVGLAGRDAGETRHTATDAPLVLSTPAGTLALSATARVQTGMVPSVRLDGRAVFDGPVIVESRTAVVTVDNGRVAVHVGGEEVAVYVLRGQARLASRAAPDMNVEIAAGQYSAVRGWAEPTSPAAVPAWSWIAELPPPR